MITPQQLPFTPGHIRLTNKTHTFLIPSHIRNSHISRYKQHIRII